jgi:RNA polymerase sigma-70 factor (ECF subfamily)
MTGELHFMERNETKLIKRVKKGDPLAFAEIVEAYKDKLYNVAFRMLGNRQEAEDVVQEAFLRVYSNIRQYDANYKFSTWMYRITTNLCIDRLRKKKINDSLDEEYSEQDGNSLYNRLRSQELTPEEAMLRHETQAEVQHAIEQLPPAYRAAILLKYLHDLSLQEISDILQIPVPTVKTRLHRGREALRAVLAGKWDAESQEKVRTVY